MEEKRKTTISFGRESRASRELTRTSAAAPLLGKRVQERDRERQVAQTGKQHDTNENVKHNMVAMIERQYQTQQLPDDIDAAQRGAAVQPSFAGAQALTRKLSEAMLGLSGKERHAVLPPVAHTPSPQHDAGRAAALPTRSGQSSGRSGVVRPQARRTCSTSCGGKQPSPYGQQALAAALSWQQASLSNKNAEGSATSDEDHPRLVPRRGAGPELRSSGREIDEYLMRLLHAGAVDASQDVAFHKLTPAEAGDAAGNADASVAFPAGWNTTKPWFVGAKVDSGGQEAVSPVQAPHVKPVMPPPPFLAQPWQGSRLGPLPPVGPLAQVSLKAREARRAIGDSSVLAAGSQGTVGTVTTSGARCPEDLAQLSQEQPGPTLHPLLARAPQEQEQADGHQRPEEVPDKRQKTQGGRPEALAEVAVTAERQPAVRDANSLLKSPPPVKIQPQPESTQSAPPQQADNTIARAMTRRVGKPGMDAIRDTLMRQQALFTEQVEDLHRIVTRQNILMRCCGAPKEEAPPAQQAQRIKKADVSGHAPADPRTVLVSSLGNGSGGSQPSTDQGSWTQVQSDTGRDGSLPSGRMNSAQQARNAQQAQSVCHAVSQGGGAHQGFPQKSACAALPPAQQALQQDQAAAQELLMLSRQAPCESLARAQQQAQAGQPLHPQGLSPTFRAGSEQLEGAPRTPTLSPAYLAGQSAPVKPGQFGTAGLDDLLQAGSGQLKRAASDQLEQKMRARPGRSSGQLPEPMVPAHHSMGRAGSCAASLLDPQISDLQNLQENMAAQLQQRSRSYPPPQGLQAAAGPGISMATQQQQQQQQNAAAWYAEFLHHMSVQQPANLVPYPNMWPWTYQCAHPQMTAQAMNAAAMGMHAAPGDAGMMWQGAGNPGSGYGLQQAIAAQAAAQQQQQAPDMQAQCNMSNATPSAGASDDAASQESARESHQEASVSTH